MQKDDWIQTNKALQACSSRLTAELKKYVDGLQLHGLDAAVDADKHQSSLFAHVTDAKLQLSELKKQVTSGQPSPTFIQDLAARISSFTQLLNNLKASQRQQYGSLLQQEQQLLEELGAVQLDLYNSNQDNWQHPASEACSSQQDHDSCNSNNADAGVSPSKQLRRSYASTSSGNKSGSAVTHRPSTAGAVGNRVPALSGGSSSSSTTYGAGRGPSSNSTLLPEVLLYDEFLARHGPTGGWHPDDHNTFLAILRRSGGDYSAALAAAADALPTQTRQSIIAHSRWHADLTELDMHRRVVLVNWRAARDAAKQAKQAEASLLQDTASLMMQQQATPDQLEKEARQLQKQMVQQWKQERLQAQQQQVLMEAQQQRQQQERERQQLQQRRLALKQQLEAVKAAKQQAVVSTQVVSREQSIAAQPTADKAEQQMRQLRVQQRNAATISRRQQLQAAKQEKQLAREKAQQQMLAELEDAKPRVDRDPSRLLSATAAAAARAASIAEAAEAADKKGEGGVVGRGSVSSGFVLHLGHKAMPAWASGMR